VENAFAAWFSRVCGCDCLIGFNGFMWSQATIVEVYPLSVVSLIGRAGLFAPLDLCARTASLPLYRAFLFGICFNNHQT